MRAVCRGFFSSGTTEALRRGVQGFGEGCRKALFLRFGTKDLLEELMPRKGRQSVEIARSRQITRLGFEGVQFSHSCLRGHASALPQPDPPPPPKAIQFQVGLSESTTRLSPASKTSMAFAASLTSRSQPILLRTKT